MDAADRLDRALVGAPALGEADCAARLVPILEGLRAFAPALEELAGASGQANVFYEPWMLGPMIERYAGGRRVDALLVFEGAAGDGRLCGFFPLERARLHRWLPLPCLRAWHMHYCFRCVPLVRAGREEACLAALLRWFRSGPTALRLLELSDFGAGPLETAIERHLRRGPGFRFVRSAGEAIMIRRRESLEAYFSGRPSSRLLQQCRRKLRRLAETGALSFTEPRTAAELDQAIDEFLALEAAGWKGRSGTSLACRPADRAYFAEILRRAFARRRLSLLCLRLDGRPIAARCTFLAPPGSFVFKIAYDEAYARYSPGLLLEAESIRRLHESGDDGGQRLEWTDTCAVPDSALYRRVGSETLPLYRYRLAAGFGIAALLVILLPPLAALHKALFGGGALSPLEPTD